MTKSKPIHELLSMSIIEFNEDYIQRYMRWCMSNATNCETDLQKLLANKCIANYYNVHFNKLQLKFIEVATPIYNNTPYSILRTMYSSITSEIFEMFPVGLFIEARKLSIVNQN